MQAGWRQGAIACQYFPHVLSSDTCRWSFEGYWPPSRLEQVAAELATQSTIITSHATADLHIVFFPLAAKFRFPALVTIVQALKPPDTNFLIV